MVMRIQRYPLSRLPLGNLFEFEKDVDSLFEDFLGDAWTRGRLPGTPAMNLAETTNETLVTMELPGVKKGDLKVVVKDGLLTVSGQRKDSALPENSRWVRNEIGTGSFSRTVELPHQVKEQDISAELANGILTIVLPKAEEARPREIQVR
jgi:HSP20 family protein